ncbi:uncharacterized protein N7503_007821 [Penicillium pulvis]|uniref:uncharacterized protein n=1 Tax=Penicillium pulvis TaxID=1562058 RepID=UPI0025471C63|nr:uncharacterized protein N7503_007821 [Penicillium pulvis]KAJ5798525.1 hypothetical protein N7503_007821 [Penicillium pulvis]
MNLSKTLGSCKEEVKVSRMGQLRAEERFRRQTQILGERNAVLDASLEENNSLAIQQAALQRWTERLDDDEARQITAQLYYDLEIWVKRHFPHLFPANKASHANPDIPSAYENGCLDAFYNAFAVISYHVFDKFLTRTMVGIIDSDFSKTVSMLDERVRTECPAHVSQHWRSAMSTATFSIADGYLDAECKQLALQLGWQIQHSSREPHRQNEGLSELLGQFVKLKFRLDSQADLYTFMMPVHGTPFNEEDMTSFTGQLSENGSIRYCLSPALFKTSTRCDPILIKKAIVIADMDWQHSSGR